MATAVSKFEDAKVPAFLRAPEESATNALASLMAPAYPYLSIKGKVFTIVRNKEDTIIMRPDDDETPANAIEVVVEAAAANFSKVYYSSGYVEGSKEKPTCASNDGITPDAGVPEPQSKKCATCDHNVWGSGQNGKGKACSDSLRLAIASPTSLNDPMLLRVPPASLKAITEYAAMLSRKGAPIEGVITKIKFDPTEATPKLQLTPVDFLSEVDYKLALEIGKSSICQQIIGAIAGRPAPETPEDVKAEPAKPAVAKDPVPEQGEQAEGAKPEVKADKKKAAPATAKAADLAAKLRKSMAASDDD